MLATADIHRSLADLSINVHRATETRAVRANHYGLAEREFQAQYDFAGTVGTLPAEAEATIKFNILFVADPGNQRDSTLDRPIFRPGLEMLYVPPGTISYVHLVSWIKDDDFNFTGAVVLAGVHCPAVADPTTVPASLDFKGILHVAVQGFAVVWDPEGPFDAGGNIDNAGAA
jgi:hypothetical protein